jgi:hypothetical protein
MSVQERRLLACPALGYIHQEKCSTKVHWLRIRWFLTVTDKAAQHQIQFQPPCLGASLRWSCDTIPANDIHAKNSFSKFKLWGFCFVVLFYLKIFNWQNNIHSGCTTQLFEICIVYWRNQGDVCQSKGINRKIPVTLSRKDFTCLPECEIQLVSHLMYSFLSFFLPGIQVWYPERQQPFRNHEECQQLRDLESSTASFLGLYWSFLDLVWEKNKTVMLGKNTSSSKYFMLITFFTIL